MRCHFVTDAPSLVRFGVPALGGIPAGEPPAHWLESGSLLVADTLDELAAIIGVDAVALAHTVDDYNEFARGERPDMFGRGQDSFDRFWLAPDAPASERYSPITTGPFYAVEVVLSDLGTKGGVVCDEHSRVLRDDGSVIAGLYAAGNTMASWTADVYPGPGAPIGSSMVFGFLAAKHAAST